MLPRTDDGLIFSPSSWSPDGTLLAGTLGRADGTNLPGVVVYSFASGRYDRLTGSGSIPVWLHDGRTLLYLDEGRIFACDARTRKVSLVLEPPASVLFTSFALGPGDRTLYTVRDTNEGDLWMMRLEASPP
jgi:hypothetical protein